MYVYRQAYLRAFLLAHNYVSPSRIMKPSKHLALHACYSKLAHGAPVPALMRFSAPVKKHWLGSFSIVPRDREGGGYHGKKEEWGGGPGPESIYAYKCVYIYIAGKGHLQSHSSA